MAAHTAQAHTVSTTRTGTCQQCEFSTSAGMDPLRRALDIGRIDIVQSVPVVRLAGELDLLTRPALQHLLYPVVASPADTVVLDTHDVTFIDCAGLRPLLQAAIDLQRRRASLLMLRPSAVVLRLAALTGTSELLDLTYASAPTLA